MSGAASPAFLSAELSRRTFQQVELTRALVQKIPERAWEWGPQPAPPARPVFTAGQLAAHLLECLAGFTAVFVRTVPACQDYARLRERDNHACAGAADWEARAAEYLACMRQGFAALDDERLRERIDSVFAQQSVFELLLANYEHLLNHKQQLFTYLRLLGLPVSTADLYPPLG